MQITKKCFKVILISLISIFIANTVFSEESINDALNLYHKGLSAKTIHERTVYLEKALALYIAEYNAMRASGKINGMLCYNIGNCYFNLKQIGHAIYYYKTGLKYLPGNHDLKENLRVAMAARENPTDVKRNAVLKTLLFFHYNLSTAQRINYLIFFSALSSFLFIMLMWRRKTAVMYLAGISFAIFLTFGASLIFEYYKPEHTGVTVRMTNVRKDAGSAFAPITEKPVGEGSVVKVFSLQDDWYYVKISEHKKGYIHKDALKILI